MSSISYSPTKKFVLNADGVGESIDVTAAVGKPKSITRIRRKGEKEKSKNAVPYLKKYRQSHLGFKRTSLGMRSAGVR